MFGDRHTHMSSKTECHQTRRTRAEAASNRDAGDGHVALEVLAAGTRNEPGVLFAAAARRHRARRVEPGFCVNARWIERQQPGLLARVEKEKNVLGLRPFLALWGEQG